MDENTAFIEDKNNSIEITLNAMIKDAENMFPFIIGEKSKYYRILEYLFCNQDYLLTPKQIDYLIDYCRPPLCQSGEMCFPILNQVIRSAEQTNDFDLIRKVYVQGIYLYKDHEYNEKKIKLLKKGVDYFILKKSYLNASELCLKLAESRVLSDEQRLNYCAEAIRYLETNDERYERAITIMQSLQE